MELQVDFVALSSQARIDSNTVKIKKLTEKLKPLLAKLKAAKDKAKPALSALAKAKKAGRVPVAVRDAAKKAQAKIDEAETAIEDAQTRIDFLNGRNKLHAAKLKAAGKTEKKQPTAAKPPKKIAVKPEPAKAPAKRKPTVVKPEPQKIVKPTVTEPEFKRSHPQDVEFSKPFLDPVAFKKAKTRTAQLSYIRRCYDRINRECFGGRMRPPSFQLIKKVKLERSRGQGKYLPSKRIMKISPWLFEGEEPMLITAIAHEAAHQAVWDLDLVQNVSRYMLNGGHGVEWQRWMNKIGLSPARFSKYDRMDFMDDEKREQIKSRSEMLQANRAEIMKTSVPFNQRNLRVGANIVYIESANPNLRLRGTVAGIYRKKVYVYGQDRNSAYPHLITVPPVIMFEPTADEVRAMQSTEWLNGTKIAIDQVITIAMNKQRKSEARRTARDGGAFSPVYRMLREFSGQ